MKINSHSSHSSNIIWHLAAILAAAMISQAPLHAATVTWTSTADGDWSTGTNWSTTPNPPATSGDDIIFDATPSTGITSTVDSSWATAGSVNSLTFEESISTPANFTLDQGAGVTKLTIGAGGITNNGNLNGRHVLINNDLEVSADQNWTTVGTGGWNNGRLQFNQDLSGSGVVTVQGSSATTGSRVDFLNGSSSAFTGHFRLTGSTIALNGASQLDRLGSTALEFGNTASSSASQAVLVLSGIGGDGLDHSFNTPITFTNTGTASRTINLSYFDATNSTLAFTGAWGGDLDYGVIISGDDGLLVRFQQDATGVTSTKGGTGGTNSAIYLRGNKSSYSIENANAFGTGNTLSVSMGENTTNADLAYQNLYAIDGITVASSLYTQYSYNGTAENARAMVSTVGVQDANADVTYSGIMRFQLPGYAAKGRAANVHLSAATGSTATFSGQISDTATSSTIVSAPVTVLGGGSVILSNADNVYAGGTSVIGGATLLANGGGTSSSTGTGNVLVGFDAASVSGDTVTGQSYILNVDTTNLHVGQTVTGTGIPAGSIITYIHPTISGRIEISHNATATATGVSLSAAAETGTLGGTGRIKPGVVNSVDRGITVANASKVAPGASIGTLTLDGADTGATLLTMNSGSQFDFELAGDGLSADRIDFWNYSGISDFALNSNAINLTLSGAQSGGSYSVDLFRFYSDSGSTLTASGITSGLVLGTLDANISGATINYNANTISLDYTVVPEPATAVLVGLGLSTLLLFRRRRVA